MKSVDTKPGLVTFTVEVSPEMVEGLKLGASVAINGVCLTATSIHPEATGGSISFDVMDETLQLTTLGALRLGDTVNVERSLKVGDEVGGHIVSGHVHGTARILDITKTENNVTITLEPPARLSKYIFSKGFIALHGVSLTVIEDQNVHENLLGGNPTPNFQEHSGRRFTFSVSLIPETLARTTFGSAQVGDLINLEVDQQTRTIVDTIERVQNPL